MTTVLPPSRQVVAGKGMNEVQVEKLRLSRKQRNEISVTPILSIKVQSSDSTFKQSMESCRVQKAQK